MNYMSHILLDYLLVNYDKIKVIDQEHIYSNYI